MYVSNIVVCFFKHSDTEMIRNLLSRSGHQAAYSCMSGAAALSACDKLGSGIIICGYRLRDMLCTELYDDMPKGFEMLLLSSPSVRGELREAQGLHIVDMPIKASELTDKLWELEAEIDEKRRYKKKAALHGRKGRSEEENRLIDGAKLLLMEKRGMEEVEAYRFLQHTAMSSGSSLSETAGKVLSAYGKETA